MRRMFIQFLCLLLLIATGAYPADYGVGLKARSSTITLKAQDPTIAVPGPWQPNGVASKMQYRSQALRGAGTLRTALVFDPSITGRLVQTEHFGTAGQYWNQNNTAGDTALRHVLSPVVADISIDGCGEFRPYPFTYTEFWKKPDVHGPDMPVRADGVCLQGSGVRLERLKLFNIPGTAIIARSGVGDQAGFLGFYDCEIPTLDDVRIFQAINGVDWRCGDGKISRLWVYCVSHVGLTIDAPGTYCATTHVCGADIGCRVVTESFFRDAYHESSRIGTILEANAHGCRFDGLNFGPGTNRECSLRVLSNGNRIRGITGGVGDPAKTNPAIVGIDAQGAYNNYEGNLRIESNCVGARITNDNGTIDLGTFQPHGGTAIKVVGAIKNWTVRVCVQAYEDAVALDMSDMIDGGNNQFHVTGGPVVKVIYPGGAETFTPAAATVLTINGANQ